MTDYKNLKLIATSSPHIRGNETTRSIMLDVIIAMVPALIFGIYNFGLRALTLTAVSVIGCVFFEWLYRYLMKKPQSIGDLSAVVTGMLLAFVSPVTVPYWMILIGDFFAIIVVKQLFGGIGKNFANPAITARVMMLIAFSGEMTKWLVPGSKLSTAATPLAKLAQGKETEVVKLLLGQHGGSLGETCAIALLIGFAYLLFRKVISWHIPVAFMGTVVVLTAVLGQDPIQHLLGGGLLLGAIFMATDYVTSPPTAKGKLIFGIGCGLITVVIRVFGNYPEGVSYAILLMNIVNPHICNLTGTKPFGGIKHE